MVRAARVAAIWRLGPGPMTEQGKSKYELALFFIFMGAAISGSAVLVGLIAIMPDINVDFGIWVFWFGLGVVIGIVGVLVLLVQRLVGR